MKDEVEEFGTTEKPSTLSRTRSSSQPMTIASGLGCEDNYFMGHLGQNTTLSDDDIKKSFSSVYAATKDNEATALVCITQKNRIVMARAGKKSRAILVYKNRLGFYQHIVLADDAPDSNSNPFCNPQMIHKSLDGIDLTSAFIINATSNFYGKYFDGGYHPFTGVNFDDGIVKYFNEKKEQEQTLADMIAYLKIRAMQRNNYINNFRTQRDANTTEITDNNNMIVCMTRVETGVMSGIVTSHANELHQALMFQAAINDMSSIVNNTTLNRELKLRAIQEFRDRFVQLPFMREYNYEITFIACIAIGLTVGGLFGGPLFLPCLFLKVAYAAVAEGAIMGFGLAATGAGLHFAYHYYQARHKDLALEKELAISDAKLYPSV